MAFDIKNIPAELINSIIEGKAVAFCGAGLSIPVRRANGINLPNWKQLLTELLNHAVNDSYSVLPLKEEIKTAITENQLLMVAQELEETISRQNIIKYLRDIFLDKNLTPTNTHSALVSIPFLGILTTNYDTLIESAYTIKNKRLPPIFTQEDLVNVSNPLKTREEFVFKIHGDINRPQTIVLNSHDYSQILFRTPSYRSFLETLFTVNTVLFIGFGLEDPDVDNLLDRMAGIYSRNNDFHYILIPKGRFNNLEKKRLALDKKILTIEYDNDDNTHSEVYEFLNHVESLTSENGKNREEYVEKVLSQKSVNKNRNISIFISYSGADKQTALQIAKILSKYEVVVWMDDFNIKVGDSVVSRIEDGIRSADYFITLITKQSLESNWVKQEIELAYYSMKENNRPRIIPIVMDNVTSKNIPLLLQDIQWLSVNENNLKEKLHILLSQLREKNDT